MTWKSESKTIIRRITTYGRKPRTGLAALKQARALLAEEGRWCQGNMFKDGDPAEVYENGSLCGDWGVCSVGAIGVVTGEMPVRIDRGWDVWEDFDPALDNNYSWDFDEEFHADTYTAPLTREACAWLCRAIDESKNQWPWTTQEQDLYGDEDEYYLDCGGDMVITMNDGSDRDTVLALFDRAIELASKRRR